MPVPPIGNPSQTQSTTGRSEPSDRFMAQEKVCRGKEIGASCSPRSNGLPGLDESPSESGLKEKGKGLKSKNQKNKKERGVKEHVEENRS